MREMAYALFAACNTAQIHVLGFISMIHAKDSTQIVQYSHVSIMLESGSESEKYIDIYWEFEMFALRLTHDLYNDRKIDDNELK